MKNINTQYKHQAGFASLSMLVLLALVVGGIGYAGYQVVHKPSKNLAVSSPSTIAAAATKYTGQSAANGVPPLSNTTKNSTPSTPATTNKATSSATTSTGAGSNTVTNNTPSPSQQPQDPIPSYIKGFIYLKSSGGANCGNHCSPPSSQPYQATVAVETTGGAPVTTFTSASDGSFSVTLVAGTYVLVPQSYGSGNINAPHQTVTVLSGGTTNLTINYSMNAV